MFKLTEKELDLIRNGNLDLLRKKIREADTDLVKRLKRQIEDTRYLQGASSVIDELTKI